MKRIVVHSTHNGCLGLQFANGRQGSVQIATVSRSPVLSNLVSSAEQGEHVTIEVPEGYLGTWLAAVGSQRFDPSLIQDLDALVLVIKVRSSSVRTVRTPDKR